MILASPSLDRNVGPEALASNGTICALRKCSLNKISVNAEFDQPTFRRTIAKLKYFECFFAVQLQLKLYFDHVFSDPNFTSYAFTMLFSLSLIYFLIL